MGKLAFSLFLLHFFLWYWTVLHGGWTSNNMVISSRFHQTTYQASRWNLDFLLDPLIILVGDQLLLQLEERYIWICHWILYKPCLFIHNVYFEGICESECNIIIHVINLFICICISYIWYIKSLIEWLWNV